MMFFKKAIFSLAILMGCATSAAVAQKNNQLVILHTNDTHSQIDPNDLDASYDPNLGGVLRRDAAIKKIKSNNENVILVDAGDFVQGTPYFNFFSGDVEIQMMNKLGYDMGILGNHEFDNGIAALEYILKQATFPFVASNYDFTNSSLAKYVKPTLILEKGDVKIGLIGLSPRPDGLIAAKNFEGIKHLDPVESTNKYAKELKEQGCDLVVVVSHLGYDADKDDKGDRLVALQSTDVDLIIGGHSHTLLKSCVELTNKAGKPVRIAQAGGRGFNMGRIDLSFE